MKKVISLLSGGLDSPVASYLMIKKNFIPIFVTFLTFGDQNAPMKQKILSIIQILKKLVNCNIKLYIIENDKNLEILKQLCMRKLTCILCKRFMIRIAKEIAKIENTNLILTGDILGEQASQTISNIYVYNELLKNYILLRPLIGWDKLEVINLNKKIGLFNMCSQNSSPCLYFPQFPETNAKIFEIEKEELNFDLNRLINETIKNAEILEI